MPSGKREGNMWRGVPRKRHLPPLNATILSFQQLSGHQDLDKCEREALRKHVAHYGRVWCPKETPFATFERYYSLFLAPFRPLRPLQMPSGKPEGNSSFATFDRYYSLFLAPSFLAASMTSTLDTSTLPTGT